MGAQGPGDYPRYLSRLPVLSLGDARLQDGCRQLASFRNRPLHHGSSIAPHKKGLPEGRPFAYSALGVLF